MNTPPPLRRVTMRDIARELGISHATVSLALSGNPRIPPERRKQVEETALSMGYRPDPMLTALTHYRNGTRRAGIQAAIAWLNFWPNPKKLRSYREFDGYWLGASEVAQKHGYHLEEFKVDAGLPFTRLESILQARSIQGILLPPCPKPGLLGPDDLKWENYSTVCFGHSHLRLPVHMVTADQVAAARIAYESIAERGYERIGFLTTDASALTLFTAGYMQSQLAAPRRQKLPLLIISQKDAEDSVRAARVWFKRHRPDAIISDHAGAAALLESLGLRVPDDVGLAALSVLDGKANAGINQNAVEIGRVAAETVISLINHNHRGIPPFQRHILVEGFWTDGSMLPVRSKRALSP
jgi:LacI family transcriptional regulator